MASQTIKQYVVYILVAAIAFFILYMLKPSITYQPHGIILPTVKELTAKPSDTMTVYQTAPFSYTTLANIHVERHSLNPNAQQEQQVLQYAEKLAKKIGANGLVVNTFGYEGANGNDPAPLAKYVLYGTAIVTP